MNTFEQIYLKLLTEQLDKIIKYNSLPEGKEIDVSMQIPHKKEIKQKMKKLEKFIKS